MSLPASARLSPTETRVGLRLFLVQAGLLGTWYTVGMPANAVIGGFALDILRMSRENVGLIGAFLYSAAVFQFLSFALTNRIRNRKRFVLIVGAGEMVFLGLVGLVPVVFGVGTVAAWSAFLCLLFFSGMCLHLTQPLLESWLSALIPSRLRGRYLGSRRLVTTGLQTVATWGGLRVIQRWPTRTGFAVVIAACCLAGLAGFVLLLRAPMPQVSRDSHFRLADFRGVLRHPPFTRYLVFIFSLYAGFALACSYYPAFFLGEVGLSFQQVGWYIIGHNILMLVVMRPTGRLVDRVGARPVVVLMVLIYALFFLLFPLFTASRYWLIFAAWALVGLADGVFWVAVPSTLYHALPRGPQRTGYLATAQGVVMISMGIGPFLVRAYLSMARGLSLSVCGLEIERFRLMFFACGVLMLLAAVAATRLDNTRDVHFGQLVTSMLRTAPIRLLPWFWRRGDPGLDAGDEP